MFQAENDRLSRRDFLRIGAAGAAGAVAAAAPLGSLLAGDEGKPAGKKKIPVGLQLYSVRSECEKDLPETIAEVGKIGYKAVEFAGYYGRSAKELRALLDKAGLGCCGTHIGLPDLEGANLAKTVEFNKILGNKFLIVAWIDDKKISTKKGCLEIAKSFDDIAAKVKAEGMRVGYHNHSSEFRPVEGGPTAWDLIFGSTKPEVVMQVDLGNAIGGGADPIAILRKYPGRAATVHLKEASKKNPKALVGDGDVKWGEVFDVCEKAGGTEWYIVEYESDLYPPVESVRRCFENLKKMGKV
jgi:sugar phosphate isomerase/epimerase